MSRNLLTSAITYLGATNSVRIAHLVRLELVGSTDAAKQYTYMTDYHSTVYFNSQPYVAGKITKVGDVRQSQGLTNYKLSIDVAGEFQEELDRGLAENLSASYVGKDIEVLRAYLDENGSIIPMDISNAGPMQYFIGDISDINISEGVISGNSTVKWQCAGKFSDFEKVNGRITDDTSHRGLVVDQSGVESGSAGAKRVEHQTDRGFQHANQAIDLLAKYTTTETRYKMKKRHWWQRDKLVEYDEEVEREVELGIDLSAKFLPKVYGVRKVPGIPVFIDALVSDPSHVYIVYAFAEGEIDAFLNFYLDNESVICSSGQDGINRVCLGNQANGDTLSAFMSTSSNAEQAQMVEEAPWYQDRDEPGIPYKPLPQIPPVSNVDRTIGTIHTIDSNGSNEQVSYFTITNETGVKEITTFHGKPNQNASAQLTAIASSGNGFVLQQAWASRTGRPATEYWDASCKLLDTAYVVMKIAITESETKIPNIEAVVSGSLVSIFDQVGGETVDQYTLNPVWQTLAYMRDSICGGDMPLELINVASFKEVADRYDAVTDSYGNQYITYWRYVGWKIKPQLQASGDDLQKTLMQCNTLLKTEDTVTKNLQAMLNQFDGTINILGGKYHLSVEADEAPIIDIPIGDIIGNISTKDLSNKNKWNSVQASITDPALGWKTNQINFFDSNYLAQDNGIKKKGNIQFRHLTNYYTARAWAKIQLAKSRYSREISFTTYYKYTHLYPNANVTLTYDRFGYAAESFRVKSSTLKSDGRVALVLEDYDNSIWDSSLSDDASGENTPAIGVAPPTGVEYIQLPDVRFNISSTETQNVYGILVWDISKDPQILRYDVRDWLEESNDYGVPYDKVILDVATSKAYILITNLSSNSSYTFKVRTISKSGVGSKYSTVSLFTGVLTDPVSFSPVTNFIATNAAEGLFDGGDLSMTWDEHTESGVVEYELGIWDATGTVKLRKELVALTEYTYTLIKNVADYSTINLGAIGAYRAYKISIRATNGLADNDPNFAASEWTELI